MKDEQKTKVQLINELAELRRRNAELEATEIRRQQTEEALRESKAEKQALLRAMPDAIFQLDQDGTYLDFIPAEGFETITPPDGFIGKRQEEVLPPKLARQCQHYLAQTLQTGKTQLFEYSLTQNSETKYYEARLVLVKKDEVLGIVRDISERKRAESALKKSERILLSTIAALDGLLVVIDRDHRLVLSNWKDHDFVPEAERQGHPHCYEIFKHLDAPCEYCPPIDTFADGQSRMYEDRNPIDGSFKEIRVTPIFDDDGNVVNVIEYVQDITKRKQAEELLKTSEEKFSTS